MSLIKPCPKCNSQLPFAGHECTRPDELQTGTTKDKYGMFEAINGCIANDLQKEVDKLTTAIKKIWLKSESRHDGDARMINDTCNEALGRKVKK